MLLHFILPEVKEILQKLRKAFEEIVRERHRFWLFVDSSNEYIKKISVVLKFLKSIWFHTQEKRLSKY